MSAKPALPTSTTVNPIDISYTEKATHVYVKVEDPQGLSGKFEGPYQIVSRPSRSQVEVRVGSYASGAPRLQTYSWSSCKIAHLRPDAEVGSRPKLGRPPTNSPATVTLEAPQPTDVNTSTNSVVSPVASPSGKSSTGFPAKIQTDDNNITSRPKRSTRNPNPLYIDGLSAFYS